MVVKEIPYFDLSEICDSGQCFRMERITENEFQIRAEDKYLRATQEGETVRFDCSEEEFETFWKYYFDLERDYGIYIEAIDPEDTYLKTAAELGSGIRILNQDLWEMIVSFLISQQNNIKRIRKCIETICRKYGERKISATGVEYYAFPTVAALSRATEEELRGCGLGYRAKYIAVTAGTIASGEISLEKIYDMRYPAAKKELMKLCGVGEKVAECICLFALHHMDAFPIDTHIRQVMDVHYKRGFPNRRYKGMRGIMQQYIFYYDLYS